MPDLTKHDWLVIALIVSTCLLIACGVWMFYRSAADRQPAEPMKPTLEIAAVDNAVEKLKGAIKQSHDLRNKLPEVLKNAKQDAAAGVRQLNNDDDIADSWNGMLGRYREDRTAAEGIQSDE